MAFCGACGTKMDTQYCPKDGWPGTSDTDQSRNFRARDNYGTMPTTQGDQSPIYMGGSEEITPSTTRTREKRLIRTLWVKLVGFLGLVGSVASITGFTLGKVHLDGLFYYFTHDTFRLNTDVVAKSRSVNVPPSVKDLFPSSSLTLFLSFGILLVSLALFMSTLALFSTLKFHKYKFSRRSRILESEAGWLQRSTITGRCPRDGGPLTLCRVVTGTKTVKGTDKDGHPTEKEKDVKELRLVCGNNSMDHRFKFDPTEIIGDRARPKYS
jgi:hypothetical protein